MTSGNTDAHFRLGVERTFTARHELVVPDAGPEGSPHEHRYRVAVEFAGPDLGEWGYLVDIEAVEAMLADIESRYAGALLNELPEFEDRNPSVERFARIIADRVAAELPDPVPTELRIRVWEGPDAWASYRRPLNESDA